jgi:BASS family bile acid:Na+ symporter
VDSASLGAAGSPAKGTIRLLRALEFLSRRASPVLAGALFIGVALPGLATACRPLVAPAVVALLVCNLLRLDWREVARPLASPRRALPLLAWILLGVPVATAALLALLPVPPGLALALLLTATSPVLTAVPAFALMLGLDGALALFAMLATTLLQPFVQPPVAFLLGVELELPVGALMLRLALFVGGAAAIALALRRAVGVARLRRHDAAIGGATVLTLVVFGIGVMDGLTAALLAEPGKVALFLAAGFVANFGWQAAGALAFRPAERRAGLTAALAGGNRNLANVVAVLGAAAPPDLLLYLAVGQFPLYFVPALAGPAYRWLLGRAPGS